MKVAKPENMSWQEWITVVRESKIMPIDTKKMGAGLLEHLDDGNVIEYNPGVDDLKPYELTAEEHAKFDALSNTPEEAATAKSVYAKLRGNQSSIDSLAEAMEKIWQDKVADDTEREVKLFVTQEGLDLFDEYVKKEFGNTK